MLRFREEPSCYKKLNIRRYFIILILIHRWVERMGFQMSFPKLLIGGPGSMILLMGGSSIIILSQFSVQLCNHAITYSRHEQRFLLLSLEVHLNVSAGWIRTLWEIAQVQLGTRRPQLAAVLARAGGQVEAGAGIVAAAAAAEPAHCNVLIWKWSETKVIVLFFLLQ